MVVGIIDSLVFGMNYGQHVLVARQQTVCLVIEFVPCLLMRAGMSS